MGGGALGREVRGAAEVAITTGGSGARRGGAVTMCCDQVVGDNLATIDDIEGGVGRRLGVCGRSIGGCDQNGSNQGSKC